MAITTAPAVEARQKENIIWTYLSLGLVIVVAAVIYSYNMFGFPLYVGDEGIYMSGAYAVLKQGWLTPYTYWYDHAPAGWLLIAAWVALTGGFDTFGPAVNSGRVLMLVLHIASTALIFQMVFRQTANRFAATAAGLLYTLSPLVLIHSRTVRLDTIMIFWTLLATALLLSYRGKLWPVVYSGFLIGVAALSKESALLLIPALAYAVWTLMKKSHMRFARASWLFAVLATISLYPLYAALRGELISFNLSSPLAGDGGEISLVGSALWQLSRSGGLPWNASSDFYHFLTTDWLINDPWILALGAVAALWNLVRGDHRTRAVALLALLATLGIAHGNQVYEFYVIAVLALFALNFGLALADLAKLTGQQALLPVAVIGVVAIGWVNLNQQPNLFNLDINRIQRQAVAWIRDHAPPNSQIVIDDELWVDLRNGSTKHQGFPGAHSHWKAANDPAVYDYLFHDDWRSIDYVIMSPGLDKIFATYPDKLPNQAYIQSTSVASFNYGEAVVEIRKVNHPGLAVREMLNYAYAGFKNRYLNHGQVRSEGGYTDARDQAAAMLMAVWMDDQQTFDEVWNWTFLHLQSERGLLFQTNEPGATPQSATEADTDAALALLLAETRWHDASYGRHARRLIEAIWAHEVVEINGKPYLAAGDWAIQPDQVIFAPATFAPYAYHMFATADPAHNWWYLLDTNYKLLTEVTTDSLGEGQSVGLPPAYVGLDRDTGAILPNPADAPTRSNTFDDYAAQVFWRVGLDAQWHDDARADDFLAASNFLGDEWQANQQFAAAYNHTGQPQSSEANLEMYSAVLPKFLIEDPAIAHEIYATKLATAYTQDRAEGQWTEKPDVSAERWAWLAAGLYSNALNNQWNFETEPVIDN
jgi:endo-1,4-beta-D-glucanase Y/4-amino-4-deoxy-L-arabinose transferase-like glycosyltransferase